MFSKFGKQARETVGDISEYVDEAVDAETARMDAQVEAMKGMPPGQKFLTGAAGILNLIPTKKLGTGAVKLAGQMLTPSKGAMGRAEMTLESQSMIPQDVMQEARARTEARQMQEQMGDVEQSMLQNESLIGDGQVEETEEQRINRQMMGVGFGA